MFAAYESVPQEYWKINPLAVCLTGPPGQKFYNKRKVGWMKDEENEGCKTDLEVAFNALLVCAVSGGHPHEHEDGRQTFVPLRKSSNNNKFSRSLPA